jgi:2Fe-2S ferredoxin
MPELIIVMRDGTQQPISPASGETLMVAIRDAGVDELLALCGGCCSCATCHVYVDTATAQYLPAMSEDENELLESAPHRTSLSRLSCQIRLSDEMQGARITIAPEE